MSKLQLSAKRIQIDKANVTILIVMSIACFVTIFSLVASKALFHQSSYQKRVIEKKETALKTINDNLDARDSLVESYKSFIAEPSNAIGGSSTGSGERDGDNAKLVLDALPSKYDFPAVASSLEKLISTGSLTTKSISGTDNQAEQAANTDTDKPVITNMPFEFSVAGDKTKVQDFIALLDFSIRPIQIEKLNISSNSSSSDNNENLIATFTAKTFYQPGKSFNLRSEVVK